MKISVVIAYYNRKQPFIRTLESITNTKHTDFEVVVVDDASRPDQRIEDLQDSFDFLRVFRVDSVKKWWMNPAIPNNIGFHLATGEVIIIQNPECLHMGDVISDVSENWAPNKYLAYGCYALDDVKSSQVLALEGHNTEGINNVIQPTNNVLLDQSSSMNRWYQHSIYSDRCLNFCTAIGREDLMALGGFDEEFGEGIGYDDTEFIARVKKKKMKIDMIDDPMVIHQWHPFTNYSGRNWTLHMKNKAIYESKTLPSDKYSVSCKKIELVEFKKSLLREERRSIPPLT